MRYKVYALEDMKMILKMVFQGEDVKVQKISLQIKSASKNLQLESGLLTQVSCHIDKEVQSLRLERDPGAGLESIYTYD
jgi:hypothetical protein